MSMRHGISVPFLSYWSCSSAQDVCCQVGQLSVPLLCLSCWAEHQGIFLSFSDVVGSCGPTTSVRCVWRTMRQKGMCPAQVVWASPLNLSLVGWFGLRASGGEGLAYVKSLTQVDFVRKRCLQKHCLASVLIMLLQKSLTVCFLCLLWQQTPICYCLL